MNKKNLLRAAGLTTTIALTPFAAEGSGFALIENSASGMGNAFAGASAIAEDASTIVFNPAGMSRLKGKQLMVAGHYVAPYAQFTNNGSTDGLGNPLNGPDADAGVDAIVPNFYLVSKLNDRWHWGLALHSPFGMTTEYDDDWVGRYHALNSALTTINFTPSIAYKQSDKLSFGLGITAQYLDVELGSAIDFGTLCLTQELTSALPSGICSTVGLTPQQSDGFADVYGTGWSYGWNVGMLYAPSNTRRLGLAYRSEVKQSISGTADFTVPSEAEFLVAGSGAFADTEAQSEVTLPASASVSYWQQVNDKVALMADATWTNWAVFDELRIHYANPNQPDSVTTEAWQDTWRYSVGMNYILNDTIMLRTGVALDQGPVTQDEYRTARVPDGERRWLSFGMGYRISDKTQLNTAFSHLFVDELLINNTLESSIPTLQSTLKGSYEASVNILSLQVTHHF